MLGVLTAQSADEPAPLAPADPHRVHDATVPRTRELAPEELPTLPVRAASSVAALAELAGVAAKLRESLAVVGDQFRKQDLEGVLHGGGDRREVAVLDELFELPQAGGGELDGPGALLVRFPQEAADGLRAVGEVPAGSVPLEPALLLGAESNPEDSIRRRVTRIGHFV